MAVRAQRYATTTGRLVSGQHIRGRPYFLDGDQNICNFRKSSPEPNMIIKEKTDGVLVILEAPLDGRPKWLYFFYSLLFLSAEIIMLITFWESDMAGISFLVYVGLIIAFFIMTVRFGNRAFASKKLWIDGEHLILIDKTWFRSSSQTFEKNKITRFLFHDRAELTDHPLAGQSMDYLGFQTEQKVINEMYGENRISFDYEGGKTISFGKDLYSWDYDNLKEMLFG